ncbi:EPOP protein, partial [Chloropsis hardwickii]|nr:EPOP protein [Chloropsis hardwickii]
SSSSSSSPPPSPSSSTPGGAPPQKERGSGEAGGKDLHKDASNKSSSSSERPGGASPGPAPCPEPAPELRGSPGPAARGEPRPEHFDRLIRQSKLWCYAKGFNVDGKGSRHGGGSPEPWRGAELPFRPRRGTESRRDGSAKRRRPAGAGEGRRGSSTARPPKTPRRNSRKGNAAGRASPARNSFSLMGSFPCTPSLVVGEDGDLRPAASLGAKSSWALSKTHPLWRWHLGGSAIPVPPSLKFRGC